MNKYKELSELLFEMEHERLSNDTKFHFEFDGWLDRYGESSMSYVDQLTTKSGDVEMLSNLIKEDFELGLWEENEDGLYDYEMPTYYGDFITNCLEKQLAVLTKVGYQAELSFN
jgi:hypothetical protein